MTLTSNVARLEGTLDRMDNLIRDLNDRISKLENSSELTLEKAKNASMMQTAEMHGQILERFVKLETDVKGLHVAQTASLSRQSLNHHQLASNQADDIDG